MSNKTRWVASSLSLCTASVFTGMEAESAQAVEKDRLTPHGPNWEKKQIAKEAFYQYLNPVSFISEGELAVKTDEKPFIHQVKKGETVYGIGLRYGVNSKRLMTYNKISNPRLLKPGQKLKIPVKMKRIRVQEGQTLSDIKQQYKVTMATLKRANPDLNLSEALYVGQVLVIPQLIKPSQVSPSHPASKNSVQLASETKPTQGKTAFRWPVTGKITSGFGKRNGALHRGIDIWNEKQQKTLIRPARKGTVIRAGWAGGYGNLVVVDHGKGWTTYYAHLSRVTVSIGQKVTPKSHLGYMGTTGNSTGVHLHFEVRQKGRPIPPLRVLPSLK